MRNMVVQRMDCVKEVEIYYPRRGEYNFFMSDRNGNSRQGGISWIWMCKTTSPSA